MSRLPHGLHGVTIEQLNMLKDLDEEQFTETFGVEFNKTNKQRAATWSFKRNSISKSKKYL